MELSYLFLYLVLILLILAGGICLFKRDQENLPPGSLGWPYIGETIEFLKAENFVYDRMKQHSPDIFKTKILGEETAVICGPNGNKFLFSNYHNIFTAFRPHSMQKLFRSYNNHAATPVNITRDAEVQVMRAPGFLKPEALVGYVGKMDSITQQQMRIYWEGKDEVKALSLAKTLTLTLACNFFLGTEDPEHVARVNRSFYDITLGMHSIPVNFPGTKFYKASKAAAAVRKELRAVIGEKKAAMASGEQMVDILSHMIVATDGSGYVGERPDIYHKVLAGVYFSFCVFWGFASLVGPVTQQT
ncbi:hypothetical protein Patl1_11656 [Pistacia atlantica]|uniref:Uncharacterized protein n=1 Tax=Pistacia atlantica TaxID=434234 RepID=A0ACC1A7K3_9ROSI|nr:hypothetical protein Patl1_11656 [Pistacia atlantica]